MQKNEGGAKLHSLLTVDPPPLSQPLKKRPPHTYKSLRSCSLADELPEVSTHDSPTKQRTQAVTPLTLSHYQAQVSNL